MIDLSGRHVLVTGASRGIGAACCRRFAEAGASVLVHFRASEARAELLLAELRRLAPEPRQHRMFRCDVTQEDQVAALFAFVAAEWGALDCLVNNAGVWVHNPLRELDGGELRATLEVNVVGPFLCARGALTLLERSPDGNIVNVSSTAGQRGEAFYSPYAASKGAVIAATRAWASELAPRVRVNAVAPGWVQTDMTAAALAGEAGREVAASIPLGRVADPDDIAGPVLFLASPLARHVTGEVLSVNGGSVLAG
ncbi:MAG TPA: SDR family oxidoreductase [Thermoanaerobaculia bacterium]|nr:SDR family oxidoreductase [Thermoanaerobaculia bacterium]